MLIYRKGDGFKYLCRATGSALPGAAIPGLISATFTFALGLLPGGCGRRHGLQPVRIHGRQQRRDPRLRHAAAWQRTCYRRDRRRRRSFGRATLWPP